MLARDSARGRARVRQLVIGPARCVARRRRELHQARDRARRGCSPRVEQRATGERLVGESAQLDRRVRRGAAAAASEEYEPSRPEWRRIAPSDPVELPRGIVDPIEEASRRCERRVGWPMNQQERPKLI